MTDAILEDIGLSLAPLRREIGEALLASTPFTPEEWEILLPADRRAVLRADRDSRTEARKLFCKFAAERVADDLAFIGASEEVIAAATLPYTTEAKSLS